VGARPAAHRVRRGPSVAGPACSEASRSLRSAASSSRSPASLCPGLQMHAGGAGGRRSRPGSSAACQRQPRQGSGRGRLSPRIQPPAVRCGWGRCGAGASGVHRDPAPRRGRRRSTPGSGVDASHRLCVRPPVTAALRLEAGRTSQQPQAAAGVASAAVRQAAAVCRSAAGHAQTVTSARGFAPAHEGKRARRHVLRQLQRHGVAEAACPPAAAAPAAGGARPGVARARRSRAGLRQRPAAVHGRLPKGEKRAGGGRSGGWSGSSANLRCPAVIRGGAGASGKPMCRGHGDRY